MFLIEFENLRVHKEILALWHREIVERIIRERLTPLVRIQNIIKSTIHVNNLHVYYFFYLFIML